MKVSAALGVAAVCVTLGCGVCVPASSEASRPTGDALKRMVAGKTVVLNTPMGGVPITYRADGTMSGRAKNISLGLAGPSKDSGTWWVAADKICQKWAAWLSAQSHCFTVRLDGRTVHWRRDDGTTGTATIVSN